MNGTCVYSSLFILYQLSACSLLVCIQLLAQKRGDESNMLHVVF